MTIQKCPTKSTPKQFTNVEVKLKTEPYKLVDLKKCYTECDPTDFDFRVKPEIEVFKWKIFVVVCGTSKILGTSV